MASPTGNLKTLYDTYTQTDFNYDVDTYDSSADGWYRDSYELNLWTNHGHSAEAFEVAKQYLETYEFPNPRRLVGYYNEDSDLMGRTMLLRATFLGVKVYFGVRVVEVIDEISALDSHETIRKWGYSYRTLKGHWEIGQITFLLTHYLESSRVKFHIFSYSKTGEISNLFYRIGFAIFGRFLQKQFAKDCLVRTKEYVHRQLEFTGDLV